MNPIGKHLAALAAIGVLLLAACGSDDDNDNASGTTTPAVVTTPTSEESTPDTEPPVDTSTESTEPPATEEPAAEAWTADTDSCSDPDAATAPIEGELKIGSYQPLSGTPAVAFGGVVRVAWISTVMAG